MALVHISNDALERWSSDTGLTKLFLLDRGHECFHGDTLFGIDQVDLVSVVSLEIIPHNLVAVGIIRR
jgi:hypothetical protein